MKFPSVPRSPLFSSFPSQMGSASMERIQSRPSDGFRVDRDPVPFNCSVQYSPSEVNLVLYVL